jgi:hypothetical protein
MPETRFDENGEVIAFGSKFIDEDPGSLLVFDDQTGEWKRLDDGDDEVELEPVDDDYFPNDYGWGNP